MFCTLRIQEKGSTIISIILWRTVVLSQYTVDFKPPPPPIWCGAAVPRVVAEAIKIHSATTPQLGRPLTWAGHRCR